MAELNSNIKVSSKMEGGERAVESPGRKLVRGAGQVQADSQPEELGQQITQVLCPVPHLEEQAEHSTHENINEARGQF